MRSLLPFMNRDYVEFRDRSVSKGFLNADI